MNKFDFVPNDEGTIITSDNVIKFHGHDVLYQKWDWEGVRAESLIFANADRDHLTDDQLSIMVREDEINRDFGELTVKRVQDFTFVNLNFTIPA